MKATSLIIAVLAMICAGCATIPNGRSIWVETKRVETADSATTGITSNVAVDIFKKVAGTLGLATKGPMQTRDMCVYSASQSDASSTNQIWLDLIILTDDIKFKSEIYGTAEDLVRAEKPAALFERALDERGVKYEYYKWHDPLFWGP